MTRSEHPLTWSEDGAPRSGLYGDVYFSADDGLAEARAVFLEGCGLPDAWRGVRHFTIAELGFGTGLNIAAALDLWRRAAPAGARLSLFSVEAHLISAEDAARALSRWPELAAPASLLLGRWPRRVRGFQRIDLPEYRAVLDLAQLEVAEALNEWSGAADAWFLDGFSPRLNPQMWREEVLRLVAERSSPGARLATYTVAGDVRRGLEQQGFSIARKPGFGRKRERLEGALDAPGAKAQAPSRIAVLGAGIAGAALARALRQRGVEALVLDRSGPGAGASGNPAALVTPALDAGGQARAQLYAQAFGRAARLYAELGEPAIIARGATRLERGPSDADRFDRIAEQDLFPPGSITRTPGGLWLREAMVVEPAAVLRAWLGADPLLGHVASIERHGDGWRLALTNGDRLDADAVIVAGGWDSAALGIELPISAVRGQASWTQAEVRPDPVVFGGYIIPTRQGFLFGATHDRQDVGLEVRPADHERNLTALAAAKPEWAKVAGAGEIVGRAAIRATTKDRLPLAGRLGAKGLYVLGGLGSHGFCTAPLLAEHVASLVLDEPSPMPRSLAALVDPLRFIEGGTPQVYDRYEGCDDELTKGAS